MFKKIELVVNNCFNYFEIVGEIAISPAADQGGGPRGLKNP